METTATSFERTQSVNAVILDVTVGSQENIYINEGKTMASFSGAKYIGKSRQRNGEALTKWFDIKVFNTKERPNDFGLITKGAKLIIKGRLAIDEYTDKEGNAREKLIIVADSIEPNVPVKYVKAEEDMPE